ncbi:MAG: sigma-70 family RNA polymerase sigma factor [Phycisphaerales bacterium]|nr:MAG: sigma-70 family RNA polymerase sigma factor [Phycisphaerales bacterium]
MSHPSDVTELLHRASTGDRPAIDQLLPLVYDELRRLAEHHLKSERADHTLQATALVHEAYLRLVNQQQVQWKGRAHFMAVASMAIRRILVDAARARNAQKRGGQSSRLSLDRELVYDHHQATDLIALHDALDRLAHEHPEKARVVEMRFFGGLSTDECATVLGVTDRSIERYWQFARAWLFRALNQEQCGV